MQKLLRNVSAMAAMAAALMAGHGVIASDKPATQPAPETNILPPIITSPEASGPSSNVVPVPYRSWLPPATAVREPRLLPKDGQHPLRPRPALDLPPVADTSNDVPAAPDLPTAPPVRIVSADPAALPVATLAGKQDTASPSPSTDPTLDLAPPAALLLSPPPRTTQAPVLVLSIPDPSRQPANFPAGQSGSEDPPVSNLERPTAPVLPVAK